MTRLSAQAPVLMKCNCTNQSARVMLLLGALDLRNEQIYQEEHSRQVLEPTSRNRLPLSTRTQGSIWERKSRRSGALWCHQVGSMIQRLMP